MIDALSNKISERFSRLIQNKKIAYGELTLEVAEENIREICLGLRDDPDCYFDLLVDICGVDYLYYGVSEWETESTTATGFSRGVDYSMEEKARASTRPRFAVVYHLLSIRYNHRVRLRTFLNHSHLKVPSVIDIWPSANWYEREAFDLFGIEFVGHSDLRRILTDYGFIGHPFRKDFPLIGNVEVRYDAKLKKVIYEPVSITLRVLEPKVIRDDNRYQVEK